MDANLRNTFDDLLDEVVNELPEWVHALLAEAPLVVDDEPSSAVLAEMDCDDPADLCGLYTGIPLTDRSVEHSGTMPEVVRLYRLGIIETATDRSGRPKPARLKRQIRITLLHELGHHFGLDEEQLGALGYE